ncbi:hypothetical protein F4804DRAFT_191555 [Jackrogersella minutella]|nr:hypothetical protein F4804DRAFT_191555 [Jackrogersella minutella]
MCVEVWNVFQRCNHRVYQNTCLCHVARRTAPEDNLLLEQTKFLPDKLPKTFPGLLQCKLKVATRPKDSTCPDCVKKERRDKASGSQSIRSIVSLNSTPPSRRVTSPSPADGIARVRDSLIMLEGQRKEF